MSVSGSVNVLAFLVLCCSFLHLASCDPIKTDDMSTKTRYSEMLPIPTMQPKPANCNPVHIAVLARHGSRLPGSKQINFFNKIEKTFSTPGIVEHLPPQLKNWTNPFQESDALVKEGQLEVINVIIFLDRLMKFIFYIAFQSRFKTEKQV